ncbi:MAG: DUF362 domain-containing protein [Phycisphaerae bacterium]|nr:DUF362 domain-containing protein [Phycisphaerae bacterium]
MNERSRRCAPLPQELTRRRFLLDSAKGAAALSLASGASVASAADAAPSKSRVVIVTHPGVLLKDYQIDAGVLNKMVEVGIKTLTGKQSDKEAWQQIAQPGQRITVKWNEMGWRPIETRPELRGVVSGSLSRHGGNDPEKVFMFSRIECKGDAASIVEVPIPNRGKPAKLRKLLIDYTDCLINMPVLKTHSGKGVCISLKNHFGSIANPSTFHSWENANDMGKSIIELNMFPAIRTKTRLIIVDAIRPQWDHGPLHSPSCRWPLNTLIFGFDTVAVDAVGTDILEQKRKTISKFKKTWQLVPARKMLAYGQEKGLGVADLNRIEIQRVELKA